MDIVTGLFVYILIWWTVIFCVLPFGIRRNTEEHGGSGAPVNPRLKEKFLITTGISLLVFALVWGLIKAEIVNFRQISHQMIEEDNK